MHLNYDGVFVAKVKIDLAQILAKGEIGYTGSLRDDSKKKIGLFRIMYREIGRNGELALSQLLGETKNSVKEYRKKQESTSSWKLHTEDGPENHYYFEILAKDVKNKEFFSKSSPFLVFYKPPSEKLCETSPTQILDQEWKVVKKTEYVKKNLNPVFTPFFIAKQRFNNGVETALQKVEIWGFNKKGTHRRIGVGYFKMEDLFRGNTVVQCLNKAKSKSNGRLEFRKVCRVPQPSFLTLQKSGVIKPMTYIYADFTFDNGSPQYPTSNHYTSRTGELNIYEKCLNQIISAMTFIS